MKVKQRRRLRKMRQMLVEARTIKVKVARDKDLYAGLWKTPGEAAHSINHRASSGRPIAVREHAEYGKAIGYFVHAEITDIGELWVKFFARDRRYLHKELIAIQN